MKKIAGYFGLSIIIILVIGISASDALAQKVRAVGSGTYPTGVPRCQITNPITTASIFMQYPFPANHDATISEQIRLAPGQTTPPASLPEKSFTLQWAVVMDKADQQGKYDFLTTAQGYSATLSSNATGKDNIKPYNKLSVALSGKEETKIKNDPITYTISVMKGGVQVATCSVTVTHTVNWVEVYKEPTTAQASSNKLFPYTVAGIDGKNYVNKAMPAAGQFSSPLKTFVGRYYDVSGTRGKFFDWGTLGYWPGFNGLADEIRSTPTFLAMPMSASVVGYKKSTFISRLTAEPLSYFKGNTFQGRYSDAFLPWDSVLQQDPTKSGLYISYDEPCRLYVQGMDADDRGYIYFSSSSCVGGITIAKDDGSNISPTAQILSPEDAKNAAGKSLKVKVSSVGADINNGPVRAFKAGNNYYLVQTAGKNATIINVTDPYNPSLVRINSGALNAVQAGEFIAAQSGTGDIKIYSAANFINGLAPQVTFAAPAGGYYGLTADKASGKFFAIGYSSHPNPKSNIPEYQLPTANLSVFTVNGGTYTETKHALSTEAMGGVGGKWSGAKYIFLASHLQYENGYLLAHNGRDIRLWVMQNGQPVWLKTGSFISDYYKDLGAGIDFSIQTLGGKSYLFISGSKVGDVFELEPVSRDNAAIIVPTSALGLCQAGHTYNYVTGALCAGANSLYSIFSNGLISPAPKIGNIKGPSSLDIGETGVWAVTATDPNNDDITWSVDWGSGKSNTTCPYIISAGTGQGTSYSASHSWVRSGSYVVKFYANDCKGGIGEKSFTVKVN